MRREVELRRRLRSLQLLGDAVGAMKSLSAHHFREARAAVARAREYRQGLERIARGAGASRPAGRGPAGLVVFGGELGLCGSYNARVVATAAVRRDQLGPGPTVCVGHRAAILLRRRGIDLRTVYAAPTGVRGIPELLLRIAEDVLGAYRREDLCALEVVSSRFGGLGADVPMSTRLLPLAPPPATALPASPYVTRDHLVSAAVRELLYITLYDLLLDALASEHGARLVATQSSERWLDERAGSVGRQLASARREAVTQEMLEIAAGARARPTRRTILP